MEQLRISQNLLSKHSFKKKFEQLFSFYQSKHANIVNRNKIMAMNSQEVRTPVNVELLSKKEFKAGLSGGMYILPESIANIKSK